MSGGNKVAKQGNAIAEASLNEQKRQYKEQEDRRKAKEASAKGNAANSRQSANMTYSNNFSQSTDYSAGRDGTYSLLTAGGTPSIIESMLGGNNTNNKLG